MDWKLYSFVIRGRIRREVFLMLENPRMPSRIAREIKLSTTHVSRAIKELREKGLVECMTPEEKTGRVYQLTVKGKELLKVVKEV